MLKLDIDIIKYKNSKKHPLKPQQYNVFIEMVYTLVSKTLEQYGVVPYTPWKYSTKKKTHTRKFSDSNTGQSVQVKINEFTISPLPNCPNMVSSFLIEDEACSLNLEDLTDKMNAAVANMYQTHNNFLDQQLNHMKSTGYGSKHIEGYNPN